MPKQVLTTYRERLEKAGAEVKEREDALRLSRRHRDQLVREAVDSGELSQREAGKAAGVTGPRVSAILSDPGDEDDE
jgi:predicted XRE-type DNA-binding protein